MVAPLSPLHPMVQWVQRELVPLIREQLVAERIIVFDPPDRSADAGEHPPGVVIVSSRFQGMKMPERIAVVKGLLHDASPVRPFCLTPSEFDLIGVTPGPVLAAVRLGVTLFP